MCKYIFSENVCMCSLLVSSYELPMWKYIVHKNICVYVRSRARPCPLSMARDSSNTFRSILTKFCRHTWSWLIYNPIDFGKYRCNEFCFFCFLIFYARHISSTKFPIFTECCRQICGWSIKNPPMTLVIIGLNSRFLTQFFTFSLFFHAIFGTL